MSKNRYRPILNNAVYPDVSLQQAREDVAWYRQCGYGGFAINGTTRQPLESLEDWLPGYMASCRNYVQAAREQELDVWIFDEWGYPSGCACGQVLTDERYRAKKYRICYDVLLEPGQTLELPCPDKFVSACAFPVDYFSFYTPAGSGERILPSDGRLQYAAQRRTRVVAVGWEYLTFVTHVMKKAVPGDPTIGTIDILSREAVARFLQCMHERYVPVLGEEFGKTVKGFFYDEPEICYDFPCTEELPAYYAERFGSPLEDILPELMAWMPPHSGLISQQGATERLKKEFDAYSHAWTELLARNFYGQIQEWCRAHGLLSIGHQDLDHALVSLRTVSGDFWANSARNDRPGVDVIWDQVAPDKFADFPRYAGSAKRTMQKSGAISETFAEMGPSMYPDRMRYTMEQQLLRGIDQFFLYTNHSREDANVRHFAAAVNDRVTRTAELLAQGRPGAQIAVYVPMDAIAFAAAHSDPHLHNSDPQAWQRVDALARRLCYFPLEYEYAWQGTLGSLGWRCMKVLLLAGETDLPEEDAAAIRAFCAAGGQVVSLGKPCLPLEDIAAFYPTADAWLAEWKAPLTVQPLQGRPVSVSLATRLLPQGRLYFLLNESDAPAVVRLTPPSGGIWRQLEQTSGLWQDEQRTREVEFQPRELKIFCRLEREGTEAPVRRGEPLPLTAWSLTGPGDSAPRPLEALLPWPQLGLGDYTGFAAYQTQFDWPGGPAELDLGDVRFAAVVTLDDGAPYPLPLAPHRLQLPLTAGRHTLKVEVLNSNANRLYSGEDTGRRNFSGSYWMLYQFERAYLDCGLLGPVKLTPLQPADSADC